MAEENRQIKRTDGQKSEDTKEISQTHMLWQTSIVRTQLILKIVISEGSYVGTVVRVTGIGNVADPPTVSNAQMKKLRTQFTSSLPIPSV